MKERELRDLIAGVRTAGCRGGLCPRMIAVGLTAPDGRHDAKPVRGGDGPNRDPVQSERRLAAAVR